MSDLLTLHLRERRMAIVDRLPEPVRRLVHEYDLPPVAAALARGARRPETIRRRAEAWLQEREDAPNQRRAGCST